MTSDDENQKKKSLNPLDDLELDDDLAHATSEDLEDIDDIEEIIEASPLGSALDNEDFAAGVSDDDDFSAELMAVSSSGEGDIDDDLPSYDTEDDEYVAKGGGMKKMFAPALVLVVAAGVAGYIMMNPAMLSGLMGGGADKPAVDGRFTAPKIDMAVEDARRKAESEALALAQAKNKAPDGDLSVADVPPQPSVNMNADSQLVEADAVLSPDEAIEEIMDAGRDMQAEMDGAEVVAETSDASAALLSGANGEMVAAPVEDVVAVIDPPEFENDLPAEVSVETPSMDTVDAVSMSDVKMPRAPSDDVPSDILSAPVEPELEPEPEVSVTEVADGNSLADTSAVVDDVTTESSAGDVERDIFENDFKVASGEKMAVPDKKPATVSALKTAGENNNFYDSEYKVPGSQIAGPRKLDPRIEPATKFVVATQDYKANDQESLVVAANRALKLRRYDAALDMFTALYSKNKRDKRILMGLAVAQQNTGRVESAINTYEEILEIDPDNADAMVNMLGLVREQYPSVALRRLMDLQNKYPSNPGIAAQIGVTQADMGQYKDAARYLMQAASLEPQNAQHLFNLAIIEDRQGNARSAIEYYEQALEIDTVYGGGQTLPRDTIYDRLAKLRVR